MIMIIRCLIVDDEPPAVEELAYLLGQIEGVEVVGTAQSASKAIDAIDQLEPDLVFLDIQMPGHDGFEVIQALKHSQTAPLFVLATAFDQYAVKAFDVDVVDYILKPFTEKRVRKSIDRVRTWLQSRRQEPLAMQVEQLVKQFDKGPREIVKISVESKGRIRVLDPQEIMYCKAENKGITVATDNRSFLLFGQTSLDELEKKLTSQSFFRTHRSYLVNLACIKEVIPWFNGRYIITTMDEPATEVPVSRRRVKELKKMLGL
jgi:two-component system, LytTR family, response regulator